MIELERRLAERYPKWFEGPQGRLARPLVRGLGRWSGLDEAERFLADNAHLRGRAFVEAALEHLAVRYTVDQVERERIPQTGRVLIVANHPSGALDALALLHLVTGVRRDVRILANDFLDAIEPLRDLLLPLRILGGKPDADSLAAVDAALAREECVIVFPAGEVSRLGLQGVRDGRWRKGFLHFAKVSGAPVLPVRIGARNSALFYGASALFKPAGTALLPRELFARRGSRIALRIGRPLVLADDQPPANALASVRQALYAIGSRREAAAKGPEPLVHAVDRRLLVDELAKLPLLGSTPDGKRIHAGRLDTDSPLLREIGRLRELTFRAAGEGTGRKLDLDAYDSWYDHLVLWDPEALEIAGAYRIADGERVLAERGREGFYTASLFRYPCELLPRLAQGMELGRSFVAPAYQGTHPGVRYLFGPVTISAELPIAARFLAFGVDPAFNNAVDGLVEVDLARVRPRKRERYLGPVPAALAAGEAA